VRTIQRFAPPPIGPPATKNEEQRLASLDGHRLVPLMPHHTDHFGADVLRRVRTLLTEVAHQ
jgi:hypothetical protein